MPNVVGNSGKSFGGLGSKGGGAHAVGGKGNAGNAGPAGAKMAGQTSYGAPIYESTGGLSRGIRVASNPQKWSATKDRVGAYNSAAKEWNAGTGPSLANTVNAMRPMGFGMEPPQYDKPNTYTGGTYHMGWNPGAIAGLAGLAVPGLGFATSPLAQKAYTALGGQNAMISGPAVPAAWTQYDQPSQAAVGPQMAGKPTQGPGNPMAGFQTAAMSTPGGAAFGPQPIKTNPMAGFFNPQLPNHTVPQGFNSAFPNSLSEQDKALLYARALA